MIEVPLIIENEHGLAKEQELIEVSVPFPAGLVKSAAHLNIRDQLDGSEIPFACRVLSVWPDQSFRWLHFSFCLNLSANDRRDLVVSLTSNVTCTQGIESDVSLEGELKVDAGRAALTLDQKEFSPFKSLTLEDQTQFFSSIELVLADDRRLKPTATSCRRKDICGSDGFNYEAFVFEGSFVGQGGAEAGELKWQSTLNYYQNSSVLKLDFTVWNAGAAQHVGGCWDLDDPGSFLLKSLGLNISADSTQLDWLVQPTGAWRTDKSLNLFQSGSGVLNSEHFNIHKDGSGVVPEYFNGYQINTSPDSSGESVRERGGRATPEFFLSGTQGLGLNVVVKNFWQNFPKLASFSSSDERAELKIDLFPTNSGQYHELQAGERKTHSIFMAVSENKSALSWANQPSRVYVAPSWLANSKVMPYMLVDSAHADPLMPFIQQGIEGNESFEKKRERIDEFGWRNFGDVFADHETLYQDDNEPLFVSHYNNQYDAIYGYARQYMQTGDSRWFKLMDELALHVADIDIYHTNKDRVEYNNGLFWHTDHYLDAQTCTHRTFSKHNNTSSTPGQTGGGPGSEHCYTTGLLYHYYLTGNEQSKTCVLEMSDWMISIHDGAESFLAQILSAKNNELKKLIALFKGGTPLPYRYPFTRGTGNYITALLDAYSLSEEPKTLSRIEAVIRDTLHPADDIALRDLGNIEDTWSYVVLLQAVGKYLLLKESLAQYDEPYFYAKAALLHYVDWIAENESPYLSRVEVLEFPNDTWVAQEIRKLNLLVSGARYSLARRERYLKRASEFLDYIVETLNQSPESHLSRIQILLLQNYGHHSFCLEEGVFDEFDQSDAAQMKVDYDFGVAKKARRAVLGFAIIKKLLNGLGKLSIKNEKDWLRTRRG